MLSGPWILRALSLVLLHGLCAALLWRAVSGGTVWQVLFGAVTGYFTLDLLVLLIHWTLDNWFSPKTRFIGGVVFYFREHHVHPMAMFQRGFVDNNFESGLIGLAFAIPTFFSDAGPFGCALVGFGAIWSGWVTTIHKAAHVDEPGRLARLLQRCGVIVSRAQHDVHHRGAGRRYGLVTGLLDRPVDALRLLEALEWTTHRVTGAVPVHPRLRVTREAAKAQAHAEAGAGR